MVPHHAAGRGHLDRGGARSMLAYHRAMPSGLRLVVVDNDADALDLACTDLRLEGHEIVATAQDGDTALEMVAQHLPDVLVVDHRMPPGLSGLEVARRVRADHPDMGVVVYSNYQDVELVTQVRATGATFLPKGNLRRLRKVVDGAAG